MPCSIWPIDQRSASSSGCGAAKSNAANSSRNFCMSTVGVTGPAWIRRNALSNSVFNQSPMRARSSAGGNRGAMALGSGKGLVQVRHDVVDVLDADAQTDAAGSDAGRQLLFRRHLPVSGRGRMAGKRLRVAEIHQTLEQLQGVVEAHAGGQAAANFEGHERAGVAAEIFLHQRVIGIV